MPNSQTGFSHKRVPWLRFIISLLLSVVAGYLIFTGLNAINSEPDRSVRVGEYSVAAGILCAIVTIFSWPGLLRKLGDWLRPLLHPILGLFFVLKAYVLGKKDFFITYKRADHLWVEWIQWQLEEAGYSVIRYRWDGSDYQQAMDKADEKAKYTLTVLSQDYLDMLRSDTDNKWFESFKKRNQLDKGCISVGVREFERLESLALINIIDLVGLNESEARDKLLADIPRDLEATKTSSALQLNTRKEPPRFPRNRPRIWNVPPPTNQFFTGRKGFLKRLHKTLRDSEQNTLMLPQAISGLSGIGKTQTAIKYAYQYSYYYRYMLWINASSPAVLLDSFINIADLLKRYEAEKETVFRSANIISAPKTVQATAIEGEKVVVDVKEWLNKHPDWLLIYDRCNDLNMIKDFIPWDGKGHILLTTRTPKMTGTAHAFQLEGMKPDEGATFLFHRIPNDLLGNDDFDYDKARKISEAMGGLPLGIENAGAYIERRRCSLSQYLYLFETRKAELFREPLNPETQEFEKTIATTWSLSLLEVERTNTTAITLLHFCAFLGSAAIPDEIIKEAHSPPFSPSFPSLPTDSIAFDKAIDTLRDFSFIEHDLQTRTLIVHPVVQTVIREGIYNASGVNEEAQILWAKYAVHAVNYEFSKVEFATWPRCQRAVPHAKACAEHIKRWDNEFLNFAEALQLLDQAGYYLQERGRYIKAEPFYVQALNIRKKTLGKKHTNVAINRNKLAELNYSQGRYARARLLYLGALADHPDVAAILSNLGELYRVQGKYEEAERVHLLAKAIREQLLGDNHLDIAISLNNLAELYRVQGKYAKATPFSKNALNIRQQKLGPKHPDVATSLNNLGRLYDDQSTYAKFRKLPDEYSEAERYYKEALDIRENIFGSNHPDVIVSLNNLAGIYRRRGDYKKSERLYKQALGICLDILGPDHPDTAQTRTNLATLYTSMEQYNLANILYTKALEDGKRILGPNHPQVAIRLSNLAELYRVQHKYAEAEPLYKDALEITEKAFGSEHIFVADILVNYIALLYDMNKSSDTEELVKRARSIQIKYTAEEELNEQASKQQTPQN